MTVIDARPPRTDLALWAGDGFALQVTVTGADWDPGTATWSAQVRTVATGAVAATFAATWNTPTSSLLLELTPAQTTALADLAAPLVDGWPFTWDLQAVTASVPTTVARGMVTCERDSTRSP